MLSPSSAAAISPPSPVGATAKFATPPAGGSATCASADSEPSSAAPWTQWPEFQPAKVSSPATGPSTGSASFVQGRPSYTLIAAPHVAPSSAEVQT